MSNPYTTQFYDGYLAESRGSARIVLPHVLQMFSPQSVVDVGCGIGTWLSVLRELNVPKTMGIDGRHVDASQLLVDQDVFKPHDLSLPFHTEEIFDLAISMEVAEHLPASSALTFVTTLTSLAPVVLFSAAIPFQGGDEHVNEQWPEYWVSNFARRDFVAYDCIRPLIWDDASVAYYYAQNAFVFVHRDHVSRFPALARLAPATGPLGRVHPRRWQEANDPRRQHLRPVLQALPHSLTNSIRLRVNRLLGSG